MNWKLPLAVLSVVLAVALIMPTVANLAPGLDALSQDLKNGNFSFLNPPPDVKPPDGMSYEDLLNRQDPNFGGLTGQNDGSFFPIPGALPDNWNMDRKGASESPVTIQYVFNPALGAMKRLKAYDAIDKDYVLKVADETMRPVSLAHSAPSTHSAPFNGKFPIYLGGAKPTPIYSVAPDAVITSYGTDASVGPLQFFKDGADTFYVASENGYTGIVNLTITYHANPRYYAIDVPSSLTLDAYQGNLPVAKPQFPPERADVPSVVLEEMGLKGERNVRRILTTMTEYFNAFGEGPIPGENEQRDPYLAIALGENGCCRHRAFAFLVTAQSLGIPTRLVANEAHAYAEVYLPPSAGNQAGWHQINLGGCGDYTVSNPNGVQREYLREADDPKPDTPPPPPPPANVAATVIDITHYPQSFDKASPFTVKGTVKTERGSQPVAGMKVDLFLNETKTSPGFLAGRGTTDASGVWTIQGEVPREAPARPYQLVAHALRLQTSEWVYLESWTDPEVSVSANTTLKLTAPAPWVDGRGADVLVQGTLLDTKGRGVARQSVSIHAGSGLTVTALTDDKGAFKATLVFPETGTYTVRATFAGDGYNRPSSDLRTLTVSEAAIHIPAHLTLARGEKSTFEGQVLTAAGPLVERRVTLRIPEGWNGDVGLEKDLFTDGEGKFSVELTPNTKGFRSFEASYTVSGLARKVQVIDVVMRPILTLRPVGEVAPGEPLEVAVALTTDAYSPMPTGTPVRLAVPGTDINLTATTNELGIATFSLPQGIPEGDHTLVASYPGGPSTLAVQATQPLKVASPLTLADVYPWLLGGLGLALAGGVAYVATNRDVRARLLRAMARVRGGPELRFDVSYPDLPEDLPPVVGPGEPVRLRVTIRTRRRTKKGIEEGLFTQVPVTVVCADAAGTVTTGDDGAIETQHAFPEEGEHPITLRCPAANGFPATEHGFTFRVVNYRRQIEEEYITFLAELRAHAVPVGEGITPRDLERALTDAGVPTAVAEVIAESFEVSNYSERAVARAEWLRFSEGRLAALRALAARTGAPAAPPAPPEAAPVVEAEA